MWDFMGGPCALEECLGGHLIILSARLLPLGGNEGESRLGSSVSRLAAEEKWSLGAHRFSCFVLEFVQALLR